MRQRRDERPAEKQRSDPTTESKRREQETFEETMAEHGLLGEDGSVEVEDEKVEYEQPPGTEQMAG
jgi:hypothetical protein